MLDQSDSPTRGEAPEASGSTNLLRLEETTRTIGSPAERSDFTGPLADLVFAMTEAVRSREYLQKRLRLLGLADQIRALGNQPDPAALNSLLRETQALSTECCAIVDGFLAAQRQGGGQ